MYNVIGDVIMAYITIFKTEPKKENKQEFCQRIVSLLDEIGGIFKLLLAILCSVAVLLIIGVTLVIKISNSGMMYR